MIHALRRLLFVWLALLLLLASTVGAIYLPLGQVMPLVSYGIAFTKTVLVVWFFMELRDEDGLSRLALCAGFVWLLFLFSFIVADVGSR